ncbi:odorant receptor 13a [Diachasma alloeum]|uniref:Odorant receptor n=1 Tax=Diachasma alloeum TaxID=454923 RepID=A0A4E0S4H1_9HYME|nr:odorant receptor 13a [Diachasma alloeum]THK33033.1 odorant receptor 6 [Diachasma alloeum]
MKNQSPILGAIPAPSERSRRDFQRATNINRWLLTPLGIWLREIDIDVTEKVLSGLAVIVCYFLIFSLLIPCALHTFLVEKSARKQMKMIGPMSFCVMAIIKYFFMIMRREKIRVCFNHLDVDWRRVKSPQDREIMMSDAKIGRFIASLCATFTYSGGFFFRTILPFAVPRKVLPDNTTMRPLIYPVYRALFNSQKTPAYEIVFATQWVSGLVMYTITVATCSLAAVLTLHACGQLKIVMSRIDDFVGSSVDTEKMLTDRLGEIVELHHRALQLVVKIEGILNEICFVEFIGCTMNICFLGYYTITELEQGKTSAIALVTYTFLMTSFTFNIFIFCYIGELLNQQGRKVGTTAYMIEWYELPGKSACGLILLLAMSNSPITITAGKMVELSYATFCNVLKTAMAYFNLLKSVIL